MLHIVLLSGNHLCHNPRVVKEALALTQAGMKVTVLGMWIDNGLKRYDKKMLRAVPFDFSPVLDLTESKYHTALHRMLCRLRTKSGVLAYRFAGIANRWQLGYAVQALRRKAMALNADLYVAHSESGMQVAVDLFRQGSKVGVDMEDWYSEDLLPEVRRTRPVSLLKYLESELLRNGVYATTPSQVMSKALAEVYNCPLPHTVYNAFFWTDRLRIDGKRKDRGASKRPSIHWYSQSIGHGRGLEDLFAALPYLERPVEIHLRGQPVAGFDDWLLQQVPEDWRKMVFVHPLVSNDELLSRIAEHDIGFAGEMKYSRSRNLTVTNKILHYLLGSLAVVASDTDGQKEVASITADFKSNHDGVVPVQIYSSGDPHELAACLNDLLASPQKMTSAKCAALRAAENFFCMEKQKDVLIDNVRKALAL